MILIVSSNADLSTNEIIDWLIFHAYEFFRINESDVVSIKNLIEGISGHELYKIKYIELEGFIFVFSRLVTLYKP